MGHMCGAYAVELLDRVTDQVVARGIFSEGCPTLTNMRTTKTRMVARALSPRGFTHASWLLLGKLREAGERRFLIGGWTPAPSRWGSRYR